MKPMSGESFFERDGKPYCKEDFENIFAAKCKGCEKPISDKAIVALEAKWHKDCFKCKVWWKINSDKWRIIKSFLLFRLAKNQLRLTHSQSKTTNRYVHHVLKLNFNMLSNTRNGFPDLNLYIFVRKRSIQSKNALYAQ